ncbi:MAG TPA: universal stress protein, partial [Anaerolineae bacterium]|nr:universal stress protein [Anaerolineae bacterium]
ENHIEAYRYVKESEQERELPFADAVCAWYDEVYLPVVQAIREQGILRYFPGRAEADLYLWMAKHFAELQRELGWTVRPEALAAKLAGQINHRPARAARKVLDGELLDASKVWRSTGQWRTEKLLDRYGDRLFADILVALSGRPESWPALDQAIEIAQREGAQVFGLHVAPSEKHKRGAEAQAIQAEFRRRCETAGIEGQIGVETGDIAPRIWARAVMADLVVLKLAHPPAPRPLARLGSSIRTIIQRCPRPILFVPEAASPLTRALLAYDGSAKAREALFVAAYLAERYKIPLVVVSAEESRVTPDALNYARRDLDMHEAQAEFVQAGGSTAEVVLKTAGEHAADLLIMGGYGHSALRQVALGSTVEQVLRASRRPVLICG